MDGMAADLSLRLLRFYIKNSMVGEMVESVSETTFTQSPRAAVFADRAVHAGGFFLADEGPLGPGNGQHAPQGSPFMAIAKMRRADARCRLWRGGASAGRLCANASLAGKRAHERRKKVPLPSSFPKSIPHYT